METNRLKKETLKRSVEVLDTLEISKNEMVVLDYFFDVSTSHFETLNNQNIGNILNGFLEQIRSVYEGQLNKIVFYCELDLNLDPIFRMLLIRFSIFGSELSEKKDEFKLKLKTLVDEILGGYVRLLINPNPTITNVMIQILPVYGNNLGKSYDEVFELNLFPKFYSKELFNFLFSPISVMDKSFINSGKKIVLKKRKSIN